MLLKGSHPRVMSRFRVYPGLHCTTHFCRIPPWSLKLVSTLPAIQYAWRGKYSYIPNVEHQYQTMPSQGAHADTTPVVWNVWRLASCLNQHKREPSGNSQLPPAMRFVSLPAGERDSSHGRSSISSTIQGQNPTPSSLLNNSRVADITRCATSTPVAT